MHHYFVVICVTKRHRDINVDASNIHTQVPAVHSMSDAVLIVFVSDGMLCSKFRTSGYPKLVP